MGETNDSNPYTPPESESSNAAAATTGTWGELFLRVAVLLITFLLPTYLIGCMGTELPPNRLMFFLVLPILPAVMLSLAIFPDQNPFPLATVASVSIGLLVLFFARRLLRTHFREAWMICLILGVINAVFCRIAWLFFHGAFAT